MKSAMYLIIRRRLHGPALILELKVTFIWRVYITREEQAAPLGRAKGGRCPPFDLVTG